MPINLDTIGEYNTDKHYEMINQRVSCLIARALAGLNKQDQFARVDSGNHSSKKGGLKRLVALTRVFTEKSGSCQLDF
jgi:hypothetical protein